MDISIIIPVYNVASFIEDCLHSVIRQTFDGAMECILVDDCGTDNSMSIADRMIKDYDGPIEFVILHHEHNRGLSAARNTGIDAARGDYIFFLDSDDEITGDCLEKMMVVVRKDPDIEVVQGRYVRHSEGQQEIGPKEIRLRHACSNEEVRCCFYQYKQLKVGAWNKLMKRSFVQGNDLSFMEGLLFEDSLWTFFWLKHASNVFFLSDVTYHYKIRPNSIITGTAKEISDAHLIKMYHLVLSHLTPGSEQEELNFFAPSVIPLFLRHAWHVPELMDDWQTLWRNSLHLKQYKWCGILVMCYVVRRSKYSSNILMKLLSRIKII